MDILSRERIPLAILIHKQFIHFTQIILRLAIHLLSTPQHAYQSFLSYFNSLFDSVYNIMTPWLNLREKHIYKYEMQLSDYNMGKYFRLQMYKFLVVIYIFTNFCL